MKLLLSLSPFNSVGIKDKINYALHLLDLPSTNHVLEDFCLYRNQSVDYKFVVNVDGESEEELGFPAIVFKQIIVETTLDVPYYSTKQHPWCKNYSHLGLVALPVFEPPGPSKCCAGVLELVGPHLFSNEIESVFTALEAFQHLLILVSPPTPDDALPNGGDTVLVNSSDQHLMVVDDAIDNGSNIGTAEQSNTAGTNSGKKSAIETSKKENPKLLVREHKIDDVNYSLSMQEPPCSNLSRGQAMANVAHMRSHVTSMKDVNLVTINAAYADIYLKFELVYIHGKNGCIGGGDCEETKVKGQMFQN
ncbi:hypothetical protein F0562_001217 [Nyssa sinensis]|uniref:GAF domain-containing protein n=1 Tax=Nyssa sinensis TaxID=561372 RepID=A0A5J5C360_9ASTE|nr:hypothetical protein F0562_001217 [Nyssa sinensis]